MVIGSLRTSDFEYSLPSELIAQHPASERDASRLMVLHRQSQTILHASFDGLTTYLNAGDALVLNRSRVIRARLRLSRPTGGSVELLLLQPREEGRWLALARPSRKLVPGMELRLVDSGTLVMVEARLPDGQWTVRFEDGIDVLKLMAEHGTMPLPPYIRELNPNDERYQTVYGDRDGSVAAPTAGLHFTPELLDRIRGQNIDATFLTLHVGVGTFRTVSVDDISQHVMHAERGEVPDEVANAVNAAKQRGGRVVAVGTTTTRLLEAAMTTSGLQPWVGETDIFIRPGFRFRAVDVLVTNFHLPRSTLLMLVSAFAGREFVLRAYEEAVRERYRFFSFGDAMIIL